MSKTAVAKFNIGQVVRHRMHPFRGVVFDVDAEFANTEEWYEAIPTAVRPRKNQPFYHLLAENAETTICGLRFRAESPAGLVRRAGSTPADRRRV
jgi:hemimethylated DNA binding protein